MKHPSYDKTRYKVWALPHPLLLHWVLNPGLAFNEVFLGQRLPRVGLIDKTSDKPLVERTFVPCPHCGTLHDGRLWGKRNAFGHWFGYVCPTCEKIIPCLWNVFSILVLALLSPLWFVPVLLWKRKWLAYELNRVRNAKVTPLVQARQVNWIKNGVLYWGGIMWVITGLIPQLTAMMHGREPHWLYALYLLPVWLLGGLGWGLAMKYFMNRKGKTKSNDAVNASPPR